jgi:hypothetical protein
MSVSLPQKVLQSNHTLPGANLIFIAATKISDHAQIQACPKKSSHCDRIPHLKQ